MDASSFMKNIMPNFWCACILVFVMLNLQTVKAQVNDFECGSLRNYYGPFDYRKAKDMLPIVENYHFTPSVESMQAGKSGSIGGDLDYTLRAFPNHARALMTMVRYGEKRNSERPDNINYKIECYLNRAWRFAPDDPAVRVIYALYLSKRGRSAAAIGHLNDAMNMGESSSSLYYNAGLIYLNLKEYEKARSCAWKAYGAGFPLPGLKDRLKRIGQWEEPTNEITPDTGGVQKSSESDR